MEGVFKFAKLAVLVDLFSAGEWPARTSEARRTRIRVFLSVVAYQRAILQTARLDGFAADSTRFVREALLAVAADRPIRAERPRYDDVFFVGVLAFKFIIK